MGAAVITDARASRCAAGASTPAYPSPEPKHNDGQQSADRRQEEKRADLRFGAFGGRPEVVQELKISAALVNCVIVMRVDPDIAESRRHGFFDRPLDFIRRCRYLPIRHSGGPYSVNRPVTIPSQDQGPVSRFAPRRW